MKTMRNIISLIIVIVIFINAHAIASSYNHNLPKGVVFQIEIGPMSNVLPVEMINKFEYIECQELPDGTFKYYAGMFKSFNEATVMENSMKFWGYEKVNVIAYFNRRNITVDDALTLQDNRNKNDEAFVMGELATIERTNVNSKNFDIQFKETIAEAVSR